jgi:phospholipid/cholesterol/gamma-HCH transport system ATP-binding protein
MAADEVSRLVCHELSHLGMRDFLDYYPAQLSGGMRKRVAIARAAIKHPRCLLYDEPTAGLDPMSSQRVVDMVHDLHRENKITSLIVTHEVHYFIDSVERMMLLRDGQIDYDGTPVKDIHNWYGYDATPTTVEGCP